MLLNRIRFLWNFNRRILFVTILADMFLFSIAALAVLGIIFGILPPLALLIPSAYISFVIAVIVSRLTRPNYISCDCDCYDDCDDDDDDEDYDDEDEEDETDEDETGE